MVLLLGGIFIFNKITNNRYTIKGYRPFSKVISAKKVFFIIKDKRFDVKDKKILEKLSKVNGYEAKKKLKFSGDFYLQIDNEKYLLGMISLIKPLFYTKLPSGKVVIIQEDLLTIAHIKLDR